MKIIFLIFPLIITSILTIEFNVVPGIYNNFTLKYGEKNIFLIEVSEGQTVNISFIMKYNNKTIPFPSVEFVEYSYKNLTKGGEFMIVYLRKQPELKNDYYFFNNSYIISNLETHYVAVGIVPQTNFSYFAFKADVDGGTFDLTNNIPKTIYNLTAGNTFYLFLPAISNQTITITLTMNKMDLPFDKITVDEKQYRNSTININRKNFRLKVKEKDKELIMYVSFTSSSEAMKYIRCSFIPKYYIKYMIAKITAI